MLRIFLTAAYLFSLFGVSPVLGQTPDSQESNPETKSRRVNQTQLAMSMGLGLGIGLIGAGLTEKDPEWALEYFAYGEGIGSVLGLVLGESDGPKGSWLGAIVGAGVFVLASRSVKASEATSEGAILSLMTPIGAVAGYVLGPTFGKKKNDASQSTVLQPIVPLPKQETLDVLHKGTKPQSPAVTILCLTFD